MSVCLSGGDDDDSFDGGADGGLGTGQPACRCRLSLFVRFAALTLVPSFVSSFLFSEDNPRPYSPSHRDRQSDIQKTEEAVAAIQFMPYMLLFIYTAYYCTFLLVGL
jgi:hypothetical protein